MTVSCPTITVTAPPVGALITAKSISPSVTTCQEPCTLVINVVWTNIGDTAGSYTPNISVNGVAGNNPMDPETLNPGQDSPVHSFGISDLSQGSYTICPIPN